MPHLMNCSHRDDSWCLDCVKAEWERTQAEIERLQAIVDRLPKDAEGNHIVQGDELFSRSGRSITAWTVGVEYVTSNEGQVYEPSALYRSRAAARKERP